MEETSRMTMERQLQMQNQARERMVAMQISKSREMFTWLASFYSVAVVAAVAGFKRSRNPAALAPLLPLTFLVGYQADLSYGSKMTRIISDADMILQNESNLLQQPGGMVTLAAIDAARNSQKET
ncbi:plasminogen receptor (KT)-like [Convolutriloba macropyga]